MKSFLMALVLMSSTLVHAHAPKVGDQAVFEGQMTYNDGSTTPMKLSLTVVSIEGEEAVIETEIQQMAETRKFQNTHGLDSISAPAPEVLAAFCASVGQSIETVTVKAGAFDACTLRSTNEYDEESVVSIAHVPFGIVRISSQNEVGTESMELVSYRFGE